MVPSVGRIVHLVMRDGEDPLPAIITHVHGEDCVSVVALSAFGAERISAFTSLTRDARSNPRWDWPPRA